MRRASAVRRGRAVDRWLGGVVAGAMRRRCPGLRSDRGSATVLGVGVIAVLCAVAGLVLALGQAVTVRHRAAGGADLAALAAADHWAEGTASACARAGRVARSQGVRLVRCVISGEISDVTAASGAGLFTAEARARAGPAGPGRGSGAPGPGSGPGPGPGLGLGSGPSSGLGPASVSALSRPGLRPRSGLRSGLRPWPSPGSSAGPGPGLGHGLGSGPGLDRGAQTSAPKRRS